MWKNLLIIFGCLLLAGVVEAATLTTGTQLKAGSSGWYEVTRWNISYTTLTINSSHLTFTGLTNGTDVVSNTTGVWCVDANTCRITAATVDELLWVYSDFINVTSAVTVSNFSGSTTNLTLTYNSSGTANITLNLEDLDGDCNYGISAVGNYTNNVKDVYFDRALTDFTDCRVVIALNSSTQNSTQITVDEDETVSETNLTTIIGAVGVTLILITKGYQWDSVT